MASRSELKDYWHTVSGELTRIDKAYEKEGSASRANLGAMGLDRSSPHWQRIMDSIDDKYQVERTDLKGGSMYKQLEKGFNRMLASRTRQYTGGRYSGDPEGTSGRDRNAAREREAGLADIQEIREGGMEKYYMGNFGTAELTPVEAGAKAQEESEEKALQATSGVQYGGLEEDEDESMF